MKFQELRLLTDENNSPKVTAILRTLGLDVIEVKEEGWRGKEDDELLEIAYNHNRWILTHDSDFGMLAIHQGQPYRGIFYLRVRNLRSQNVINVCQRLMKYEVDFSQRLLIVVEESRLRIR